jgi:hypothetical protein
MADISKEINDFRAAVYGRDVRESMISLAEKVNEEVETNTTHVDEAVTTANGASQKATKASEEVQKAITEANTTLQEANAAKVSAQESATASAGSASAAAGSASAASGSAANAAASAKAVEDIAAGLGGFDGTATSVKATDTQGIVVAAGADSNAQALLDALARKVALELVSNTALTTKLADYLKKTDIVQTESTATNKVPSSAYLKQVKDSIDSNLGEHFSEAERQIGTWMGKPLYRQCFHPTVDIAAGTQSYNISLGLSGVEVAMIDYAHTWCMGSSNTDVYCIPYVHNDAVNNVGAFLIVENADVKFAIRKGTNTSIRSIWITLTYTKTTDS